jgi:hypothetical protein
MGIRGEIFSNKVSLPNRTYFFNVKENRMGDLYLNIVESKNRDNGGFDRQSVILFADDLQEFLKGFEESLKVLEKAVREKRHTGKGAQKKHGETSKREEKSPRERRSEHGDRVSKGEFGSGRGEIRRKGEHSRDRNERGRKGEYTRDRAERGNRGKGEHSRDRIDSGNRGDRKARGKRVVVKKRD